MPSFCVDRIGANRATERVYLLNHILGMIVQPNAKQHLDIQKLNLNVEKLQAATDEALSAFFLDKDNPNNGKKKPYLKELFHVARFEERYRNGEIGTSIPIYYVVACWANKKQMVTPTSGLWLMTRRRRVTSPTTRTALPRERRRKPSPCLSPSLLQCRPKEPTVPH